MSNTFEQIQGKEGGSCCAPSCCGGEAKAVKAPEAAVVAKAPAVEAADVRAVVKERYGKAVEAVTKGAKGSCCGSSSKDASLGFEIDPITRDLYSEGEKEGLPAEALLASFGCGNPTALAELRAGEVVLDLGSGGGIDVLLSARRVGPTGKAYGLDMTDEMLALANENKKKAGATNVEFLRGHIEEIPLPSNTADVIISNCVINLSGDKDVVLREAFRVLKPGGRLAVSDIVLKKPLPAVARKSMELWTGCVAGALVDSEYMAKLHAAGFTDIGIEPTRVYTREDTAEMAASVLSSSSSCCGGGEGGAAVELSPELLSELDGAIMSAFVRATKPA